MVQDGKLEIAELSGLGVEIGIPYTPKSFFSAKQCTARVVFLTLTCTARVDFRE